MSEQFLGGNASEVHSPEVSDGVSEVIWSNARRYYALGLMCTVSLFNFIDRQIITILIEPIKQEFGVSDSAMGLLTGLIFTFFYVVAGIPLAWLADRMARGRIIAFSLAFWSIMTSLGGFANSLAMLMLTRIGVAVGEAGATPACHSLISDLFPLHRRALALSLLGGAASIGIGAGVFLGGWLVEAFSWRTALMVVGLPGVMLALVVFLTLKEPARGMSEQLGAKADKSYSTSQVLRHLWQRKSYRYSCFCSAAGSIGAYGMLAWGPTFYLRVHGLSAGSLGFWMGLSIASSLFIGQLVAGSLIDRLGRSSLDWYLRVPAISVTIAIPFGISLLLVDDWKLSLVYFGVFQFFMVPQSSAAYLVSQTVVPPRMRATASVVLIFFNALFGLGLAPFLIGVLNDALARSYGTDAVRYSLLLSVCFIVFCIFAAWRGSYWVKRDYAHMVKQSR